MYDSCIIKRKNSAFGRTLLGGLVKQLDSPHIHDQSPSHFTFPDACILYTPLICRDTQSIKQRLACKWDKRLEKNPRYTEGLEGGEVT